MNQHDRNLRSFKVSIRTDRRTDERICRVYYNAVHCKSTRCKTEVSLRNLQSYYRTGSSGSSE